jgi:hypothetical protein
MKEIGVLTFHRCINYGSYWQARCLVEGIQNLGYEAMILDHHSAAVNIAEWKCAYQPVLPTKVPASDYPHYRKKIEGFFQCFEKLPLSPSFEINQPEQAGEYDTVVVGSDEVWNLSHPWYGKRPLFFGEGIRTKKLISYAASFGNYDACWLLEQQWKDRLLNFGSISVRDDNSKQIIKTALNVNAALVLDPCLLFPIHIEERLIRGFERPYVAVYGHNFSASFIYNIRRWASHRNVPLVSIGYRNDWADQQWITANPLEFANFISGSEAVATNFFHGCVFAMANKKSFVCETSPYRNNKLKGLMERTGAENHLVWEDTSEPVFNRLLNEPLQPGILSKIEKLRADSLSYLTHALRHQPVHQYAG